MPLTSLGTVNAYVPSSTKQWMAGGKHTHWPLIDMLARLALQIQLCETTGNQGLGLTDGASNWLDAMLQAFKARDIPRAALLVNSRDRHSS